MSAGFRRRIYWLLTVAVCLALPSLAHKSLRAADPLINFHELMAGANGDSRIQFITIVADGARATCWGPQVAPGTPGADADDSLCYQGGGSETRSRNALVFFDSQGRETGRYKFPENPPPGSSVSGRRRPDGIPPGGTAIPRTPGADAILIATDAFAQLAGSPAPDFVMPPMMNSISGKVCFVGNTAENANALPINLCMSYGAFAGDNDGAGPPAPSLPILDAVSLRRTTTGFDNRNSSFSRSTSPAPSNRAGQTFSISAASKVSQGEALFRRETFGGNGRTCGECHPSHDSGRLTPADVQARFKAVASTFDTLFLGETAATGFDFNLNTLTIASRPVPVSGTDFLNSSGGDLRGILTSSNGVRAKVLARTSATTYLVYGGFSPRLSGTVTDETGNAAGVVNVLPGNLDGLEQPLRMRTSRSPGFPEGRALILENLDGFDNPPVFRKSPHILNLSRTAPFGFDGRSPNLRLFTLDAVRQHFPRTLARSEEAPNPDFRMPTPEELEAMEAFQLAQEFPEGSDPGKFDLNRFATTPAQQRGRNIFFGIGKCVFCHGGPVLATTTVSLLGQGIGVNGKFNTGVARQPINGPGTDNLPCEPTVGACASREFSVPSLFNVKNQAPFFHDGSAATLRDAVNFYNSAQFAGSPAARAVGGIAVVGSVFEDLIAFLEGISGSGPIPLTSTDRSVATAVASTAPSTDRTSTLVARPSAATGSSVIRTNDGIRLTATAIAGGLSDPTDVVVASDGRIFIAERSGRIRVVRDGRLLAAPVLEVPGFDARDGAGVLTIGLDPNFARTSLLYALYTASTGFQLARFRVVGDVATERAVLIDRLGPPSSQPSAVLRFGPDGALYLAIDDGDDVTSASNPGSFSGKVLRVNADATTPRDQTSASPVFAMEISRPSGLDWDGRGRLWVAEPGEVSGFSRDDPRASRAVRIARHRFPDETHGSGLAVYRNPLVPQLSDNLLIGASLGRGLLRVRLDVDRRRSIAQDEWLFRGVVGDVRVVLATAEGTIYLATTDTLVRVEARPSDR